MEDVGFATAFLAHDAARLMTGSTLYVDRGYHIIDWSRHVAQDKPFRFAKSASVSCDVM